jgi:DNA-binding MarR family transcriptional regulator
MNKPERNMEKDLPERTEPAAWPYEALKRFRLIFRAVQQHSQWVESRCGVSSAQLWAMSELSKTPGLKVTELAKAMSIHQSTASNLLLKLEKTGLIRRERPGSDQRVVRLYLTEPGRELVAKAPDPKQGLLQHALFELPDPVLTSLTRANFPSRLAPAGRCRRRATGCRAGLGTSAVPKGLGCLHPGPGVP